MQEDGIKKKKDYNKKLNTFYEELSEKNKSEGIKSLNFSESFQSKEDENYIYENLILNESSNENFNSMNPSTRKKKPEFNSIKRVFIKDKIQQRKPKGIKSIHHFGGKKMFIINPKSYSTSYMTKKHLALKNRDKSVKKRKYRDKKSSMSNSSVENIIDTISVKERTKPDIWSFPNKEKYFLKKSKYFDSSKWKKNSEEIRENDLISMYQNEKIFKKNIKDNSILKRISKNCKKIITEQSIPSILSRVKIPKIRNLKVKRSMQSLLSLPGKKGTKNIQCPSITSIDPLYLHAFMKKKNKPKLRKGLSFFMARFKSKRIKKSFYVFENEEKVVKFRKGLRNKIIEHTNDDDYDTDDEQMKLAIRQCKKDFLQALSKVKKSTLSRKRAYSMINLAKKNSRSVILTEQFAKLQKLQNKGKKNKYRNENSRGSRRQTRKNLIGKSIVSHASTVASSSFRKTHKSSKERGKKMIKNEFYNGGRGKRRAISILPKGTSHKNGLYQYFPKGCRKRNKMGF